MPSEYWITVASFHPRKNQESILNAYQYIPENKRIPLVFTGEGKNKNKLLELSTAKGLEKWVYPVGHIPTEHLISLLHGSKGLLYPSLYEGFGLPALEALQLEVPVIAHRGTSLEEVCGAYGNYVDTQNAEEFADTLIHLGQSPKPRFAEDPGFLAHLSNFSTEKLVSDLHKIYYK
ncbi:MAG: glycosyltransferase [Saprospiraceae bacterium]|nr:glycosyltransferase [Saprospiraceae bacterium]